MPTFVKFLLACLLCLAVVGGAALLIQGLLTLFSRLRRGRFGMQAAKQYAPLCGHSKRAAKKECARIGTPLRVATRKRVCGVAPLGKGMALASATRLASIAFSQQRRRENSVNRP